MDGRRAHQFQLVDVPDKSGAQLFLDTANLDRAGRKATALSLVVLGADDERNAGYTDEVVALRQVEYDCAAQTMTIEAMAAWNRHGRLTLQDVSAWSPRAASASAAVGSEINAACLARGWRKTDPAYASVDDAWAHTRSTWPARPEPPWRLTCLWNALTPEQRNTISTAAKVDWRLDGSLSDASLGVVFRACHSPDEHARLAGQQHERYGMRQAAIDHFRAAGISEARLRQSWQEVPWRDRQTVIEAQTVLDAKTREAVEVIVVQAATPLGLSSYDDLRLFGNFINAQAILEPD